MNPEALKAELKKYIVEVKPSLLDLADMLDVDIRTLRAFLMDNNIRINTKTQLKIEAFLKGL